MDGRGTQRLLRELPAPKAAGQRPEAWFEPGVIATVTAGAASDGNALVTVTWRGAAVQASYPADYTPVVGHNVLLLIQLPQIQIMHRTIGTP